MGVGRPQEEAVEVVSTGRLVALLGWVLILFAVLVGYIGLQVGMTPVRAAVGVSIAALGVGLAILGRRIRKPLIRAGGRRLWRSGRLGRIWLDLREGQHR